MDLEKKSDVDGERSGRHLQEGGLIGKEESTSVATEDGRRGRLRRATFDDLNAIMDIKDNIYEGLDYMPMLFHIFMQSKLHVIYVYE